MLKCQNLMMQQKLKIRLFVASYIWFRNNVTCKDPSNVENYLKLLFFIDFLKKIQKQNLKILQSEELMQKDTNEYKLSEEILDINYSKKTEEKNTTNSDPLDENQKMIKEKLYEKVSSLVEKAIFFEIYDEMKHISYTENNLINSAISNKLEIYQDHLFETFYKDKLPEMFIKNKKSKALIDFFWDNENYLKKIIDCFSKESYDKILENKEKKNDAIVSD